MNDLFLGNYIAGNFSPKESVSKGAYTLEKRDGVLCLMNGEVKRETAQWLAGSSHRAERRE